MKGVVARYLARHARAEAGAAEAVGGTFACTAVLPIRGEGPDAVRRLITSRGQEVLWIIVVNATQADGGRDGACVDALVSHGRATAIAEGMWTVQGEASSIVVDRATGNRVFADEEGVGLARRIGLDLALGLYARGVVRSPWLRTTDADARPGPDFFADPPTADHVAALHPFWHVASGDAEVDRATALYEIMLRYHVVGLARARSPWAHHSLGSVLSVRADAYAEVRGMPCRTAGEDFHLLAKLAKIGPIRRGDGAPVEIVARRSHRVPFGTGPAVAKIIAATRHREAFRVYHPGVYERVGRVVDALGACEQNDRCDPAETLEQLGRSDPIVASGLRSIGGVAKLRAALAGTRDRATRRRRCHEWFDALRTLRFIHGMRDAGLASVPWVEAVGHLLGAVALGGNDTLDEVRRRLAALEPVQTGL